MGNVRIQNDRQPRPVENDDRYIAELLQRYGQADELARRQWREGQQTPQQVQLHPSQEYINTDVSISKFFFLDNLLPKNDYLVDRS